MAWYNNIFTTEKANPSQPLIAQDAGKQVGSMENPRTYTYYYENLEIVNRAINMIVDDVAEIPANVTNPSMEGTKKVAVGVRQVTVNKLINLEPNPFQDISTFKRNLLIDFMIDGNIFIYFDGAHMYHLPANKVEIIPDEKNYIAGYTYDNRVDYKESDIIHIKDNSFNSIYRGVPRLKPAKRTMQLLSSMRKFQDEFFKNGAIPGLVLKTENTMSERNKERTILNWKQKYNPTNGGFSPMILDGGTTLDIMHDIDFRKLGFQDSVTATEKIILQALGIPYILFDGGNNGNIRPNHRLYYLETILPIVRKINYAYERFFGFSIKENITDIPALQPELAEQAKFYSTLVNGGILTPNEGRIGVGAEPIDKPEMTEVRVPENIAGSASNPSDGGRPQEDNDD